MPEFLGLHNVVILDLDPVCCKKRQKIVPGQLLVCGVGDPEGPEGFQTDSK